MTGQPDPVDLLVRAAWVCPIVAPPLRDGWIAVAGGRITAVGRGHDAPPARAVREAGAAALLPGLVNAHTHLELSWLRGRVPPSADFLAWVGRLMALRRSVEDGDDPAVAGPVQDAIAEAAASGTVAIGDIANALITPRFLAEAGMPAVVFHELIGFRVTDGAAAVASARARHGDLASNGVRITVAPHAPFSVSAELFRAIRDAVCDGRRPTTSVHVGESPQEVQLLADGSGPWRARLGELRAWRPDWQAPGCGPGDYLCDLGVLGPGALAVHGVQLTDRELERLAASDVTLVTCPRSNRWVGVGDPPVARFLASGVRLAVGTDSLASAPDLNLFGELAALRQAAPDAPARRLLAAATLGGAEALGLEAHFGSLEAGKRAVLVAVDLPAGTGDAEEALLGGVGPSCVRVLDLAGYDGTAV
ncbi:MAG: amidohydrolase family protein [Vicinamibacterales bacterium]